MFSIVPLAGPDFVHPHLGVRPLIPVNGKPLIESAVKSRPWFRSGRLASSDLIFAFRETEATENTRTQIKKLFRDSRDVVLSGMTAGALHTILAGAALIEDVTRPIAVDLADILFDSDLDPVHMFEENPNLAAIVPYFESSLPCYSYLEIDNGQVRRAKEKQVISSNASAGVYIFRDVSKLLAAASWSAGNYNEVCYGGAAFVCPAINGLIQAGWDVAARNVENPVSISKNFHASALQNLITRN